MKQYCRYCVNLYVGNGIYCQAKKRILAEATTKSVNHCKMFNFCEIDAYDTGRDYKPHVKQHIPHKINREQLSIFVGGET